MSKLNIGVIGCGNISGIYFKNGSRFGNTRIIAAADIEISRAKAKVEEIAAKPEEYKIDALPQVQSVADLLANPDVQLVLNLTTPKAHAEISLAALNAGKHTYAEKPFAVTRGDGQKIMDLAKKKNLRVGCAPDTFLGGAHQACRRIIDDGLIGTPHAATAFMTCPGHERWHPSPEFYYETGGGPMFDMGPYYLTALINMLGPVRRVAGMAKVTHAQRLITSQPKNGQKIKVETPTHITTLLEFVSGATATLIMSFDIWKADLPRIEVYGDKGTLSVPDPNMFGGPVKLWKAGEDAWTEMLVTLPHQENSRGIGVADMATALQAGAPHRASGELAMHVLDIMAASLEAAAKGTTITLTSTTQRPAMLSA